MAGSTSMAAILWLCPPHCFRIPKVPAGLKRLGPLYWMVTITCWPRKNGNRNTCLHQSKSIQQIVNRRKHNSWEILFLQPAVWFRISLYGSSSAATRWTELAPSSCGRGTTEPVSLTLPLLSNTLPRISSHMFYLKIKRKSPWLGYFVHLNWKEKNILTWWPSQVWCAHCGTACSDLAECFLSLRKHMFVFFRKAFDAILLVGSRYEC